MEYVIVAMTAAIVAALTLFSGFGLGTLLLPAFAAFFPVEVAVAATAVVHLANNLFKLALVGRHADRGTVIAFALPAVPAALAGAWLLGRMAKLPVIASYRVFGFTAEITGARLVIGGLIIVFALFDLVPRLRRVAIDRRYLPLGGVLAGFFGGLSGHQGALRAAFLVKAGLDRDAFIGTSVVAAVIVDVVRLAVYGIALRDTWLGAIANGDRRLGALVLVATGAAFLGSYVGARLVPKVTIDAVQTLVGVLLIAFGAGIAAGWI